MMTISESQYSTNQMSSYHKINDRIVHQDNFDDTQSSLVTNRGFKPSDMYDPQKKQFLTNLSYKLFPVSWNETENTSSAVEIPIPPPFNETENTSSAVEIPIPPPFEDLEHKPVIVGNKEVDLNKIFTPAPDAEEHLIKKGSGLEKTFASSAFYVPGVHPTVKEQMDLARAISRSLSDSSNQMSRGQSMYVNRKKRSVKWVHEGRGRNTSNSCSTPTPVANHDTPYRPPSSLRSQKTYPKPALKNPTPTFKNPTPAFINPTPKHNPFSSPPPLITGPNLEIPLAPTKLNDFYARPKSPRLPLVSGPNFNVAPRGWGEMREYYRPVALDSVGRSSMIYTDY